ncbi:MAG: carbon starvation protein A, partial [Deltaproteobacteria bacterium]|nr:carbon starvation protein A [Deltaproteobacteria bacterium]
TLTASWKLYGIFDAKADAALDAGAAFSYRLDSMLVALMAVLAVIAIADSVSKWWGFAARSNELPEAERVETFEA